MFNLVWWLCLVSVQALCCVSTRGLVQMLYSQTELDLQSHRCIVNKQKSSLPSARGFIDAMLRNVLHSSNNNFPKAILFDYNPNGVRLEMLSITLGRQGRVLHVGVGHAVQGLEKVLRFEQQGCLHAFTPCARGCHVFRPYDFTRVSKPVLLLCV